MMTRRVCFALLFSIVFCTAIITLALAVKAVFGHPFKRELLVSKFHGDLPRTSWLRIVRLVISPGTLPGPLAHLASVYPISSQSGPCPILWETPFGPFWGRSWDGDLLVFLMAEQDIVHVYERAPVVVRKGDVVLDAGANLGTFTRFALRRGAQRVIAFEPEPTNIACFKDTFRRELDAGQVVLVEAALWDSSSTLDFSEPPEGNSGLGSVVGRNGTASVTVRATTIDESVAGLNLDRVDFIKMDIEGAEARALLGGPKTLARFSPRMALSIEHLPGDAEAISEAVLRAKPDYRALRGGTVFYFYPPSMEPPAPLPPGGDDH